MDATGKAVRETQFCGCSQGSLYNAVRPHSSLGYLTKSSRQGGVPHITTSRRHTPRLGWQRKRNSWPPGTPRRVPSTVTGWLSGSPSTLIHGVAIALKIILILYKQTPLYLLI
jgi:hypothetical protein